MQLFTEIEDHYAYLAELVKRGPKGAFIASFGVYAGITYDGRDTTTWGEKYKLHTRNFLDSLRTTPNVKLLIGIPDHKSCRGMTIPCEHCERGYINQMMRLLNHMDMFSAFKWRIATQAHVKCTLLFFDNEILGVAGGRNLNDSNSVDATFQISADICHQLYKQLVPVWKNSRDLTSKSINEILAEQEISEKTVSKILSELAVVNG